MLDQCTLYIRSLMHGIFYHAFLYIGMPMFLFPVAPILRKSQRYRQHFINYTVLRIARILVRCAGVRIETRGLENMQRLKDQTYILIANHITSLDVPVQMVALNKSNLRYVYSLDVFGGLPIIGGLACKVFDTIGWIGVRKDNVLALKHLRNYFRRLLAQKANVPVVIFPEGRRAWQGDTHDFRQGAFYLAYHLRLPILPVLLHGIYACHKPGNLRVHPQGVKVEVLAPFFPPASNDNVNARAYIRQMTLACKSIYDRNENINHTPSSLSPTDRR